MSPVPRGIETPQEFIAVSPELVKFMGGKIALAAVWEKIRFRCSGRHAVAGGWWACSYADMAELTGLSSQACRRAVARLEELGHIESRELKLDGSLDRTKAYRPVFESRDAPTVDSDTSVRPIVDSDIGGMSNSTVHTYLIEEIKTQEGGEGEDPRFAEWYQGYPRKSSRGAARTAFAKALKKADLETLTRGRDLLVAKVRAEGTEPRYIKHASTWLNQECWDDDYGDVILPGFEPWWAKVVSSGDVGEVSRVLGLTWQAPDVPDGAIPRVFLAESRASWLADVRSTAESRWATQFGDLRTGP